MRLPSRHTLALGPIVGRKAERALRVGEHDQSAWERGVSSAVRGIESRVGVFGALVSAAGGAVGVVSGIEVAWPLKVLIGAAGGLIAYWLVVSAWAGVVALAAPLIQRDAARTALARSPTQAQLTAVTTERNEAREQLRPLLNAEQAPMPRAALEQRVADLEAELGRYHAAEEAEREKVAADHRRRQLVSMLSDRAHAATVPMRHFSTIGVPDDLEPVVKEARLTYRQIADMIEKDGAEFGMAEAADTVLFRVRGDLTLESVREAFDHSNRALTTLVQRLRDLDS